jgi:hypothetical protein
MTETNTNLTDESGRNINPVLGNVFFEILNNFCSQDELRPWMKHPFNAFGKTLATNGWVLIATPKISEYLDNTDKIKNVYPVVHNMQKIYDVATLETALAKFPTEDEFDSVISKCNACNGDGVVDFEFSYNGKTYEIEEDCPVCDGEGEIETFSDVPNGKKRYDETKLIKINECGLSAWRVADIVFVANKLKQKTIKLINNTSPLSSCLFKIGDIEMLVMPSNIGTDADVIENIA